MSAAGPAPLAAWRCFPWDPRARRGAPFSPTYLVPGQTVGRFDLHDRPPVRYLSESPEHAIGEVLSPFRGTTFHPSYLRLAGHRLALAEVTLASSLAQRVYDLTDPVLLARLGIRPDELAHHDRTRTQALARRLYDLGEGTGEPAGIRWWSALTGAWHGLVLFSDRVADADLAFGRPRHLEPDDPALAAALSVLGIRSG